MREIISQTTDMHLAGRYDKAAAGWGKKITAMGYPAAYRYLIDHAIGTTPNFQDMLDVGTGCGNFASAYISAKGAPAKLCLLDISHRMLEVAKQNILPLAPLAVTHCGALESLPYRNRFDLVLCAHTIEHSLDPAKMMQNLHASISANGSLLLVVSKPHWCTSLVQLIWRNKAYSPAKVVGLLTSAGFENIKTFNFPSGPPSRTSMGYFATKPQE